jgi:hypothetical protein
MQLHACWHLREEQLCRNAWALSRLGAEYAEPDPLLVSKDVSEVSAVPGLMNLPQRHVDRRTAGESSMRAPFASKSQREHARRPVSIAGEPQRDERRMPAAL